MIDEIQKLLYRIVPNHTVTETSHNEYKFTLDGINDTFHIEETDEYTLFTDNWHEHFGCLDDLEDFLEGLFSGKIKIVLKYRGKTLVGHKASVTINGKDKIISFTGAIASPFWRKKSYKKLKYKIR